MRQGWRRLGRRRAGVRLPVCDPHDDQAAKIGGGRVRWNSPSNKDDPERCRQQQNDCEEPHWSQRHHQRPKVRQVAFSAGRTTPVRLHNVNDRRSRLRERYLNLACSKTAGIPKRREQHGPGDSGAGVSDNRLDCRKAGDRQAVNYRAGKAASEGSAAGRWMVREGSVNNIGATASRLHHQVEAQPSPSSCVNPQRRLLP